MMKAKILTRFNALLAFLLGLLGFGLTGCFRSKYGVPDDMLIAEYGCPYATLDVQGKVSGEHAEPLEHIRVATHGRYEENALYTYTDEKGNYQLGQEGVMPPDSIDIIATDTAGIYETDSVRVGVTYDRSGVTDDNHWNEGTGVVYHDFQLKKK